MRAVLVLAGLILFASCGDPAANKSRAVGEATQASPQPSRTAGQKYSIT